VSWISPTGYEDPNNKWSNEPLAYDEDTYTYATTGYCYDPCASNRPLILTVPALQSNKIRIFLDYWGADNVVVDVRKGGVWTNVYTGAGWYGWKEFTFAEGSVDAMRINFHVVYVGCYVRVGEADFWGLPPAVVWGGSALPQLEMGKAILGI